MAKVDEPYFIEIDTPACTRCKQGKRWTVIGPDGYAIGESWDEESAAVERAQDLNDAFAQGRSSMKPTHKKRRTNAPHNR